MTCEGANGSNCATRRCGHFNCVFYGGAIGFRGRRKIRVESLLRKEGIGKGAKVASSGATAELGLGSEAGCFSALGARWWEVVSTHLDRWLTTPYLTDNLEVSPMPTYEYLCTSCGHEWEFEQSIKDDPERVCQKCKQETARRQISRGTGFILKGGGWYSDLYSSTSNKPKEGGGEKPSADAGSSTSSSESKPSDSSTTAAPPKTTSSAAAA